jgi:hypothetical protein
MDFTHEQLDLIGHGGYAILAMGMALLATGRNIGWAFRLVGEIIWIWIGWELNLTSSVLWGVAFAALDAVGMVRHLRRLDNTELPT